MSTPTEIELKFADGLYRFWLPIPVLTELENKRGSICAMEFHLRNSIGLDENGEATFVGGDAVDTVTLREVIRLGLIGGNAATVDGAKTEVGPNRARELVETYCYPARPVGEAAALAWRILAAAIYGNEPQENVGG